MNGDLFASDDWLCLIEETFGFAIQPLEICGRQLPFAAMNDVIGNRLQCLPYTDYVEIPMPASAIGDDLKYHADRIGNVEIKARLAISDGGEDVSAVYHRLAVSDEKTMWSSAKQNFRWGVSRARREFVEVRQAEDIGAVKRFYNMFRAHRRGKFAVLTHPWAFFENLHQTYFKTGRGFILEAWAGDNLAAAFFVLVHSGRAYYKFSASSPEFLRHQPNNILMWTLIEKCLNEGLGEIDLGMTHVSDEDIGVMKFKSSTGAEARPIRSLSVAGAGFDQRRAQEARALMTALTAELVRLDVDDGDLDPFGALMFRYFN